MSEEAADFPAIEPPTRPRRTVKQAVPVQAEPPLASDAPTPLVHAKGGLDIAPVSKFFFLFFIVGTLVACFGWLENDFARRIAFAGPVLSTVGYAVLGWTSRWHDKPTTREKFADNCYYLGFIFTQVALVFGFAPVALWGQEITAQDVLRYFGMALGSSLIGLVARTLFLQAVEPSAVDDEVEQLANDITHHSRIILRKFQELSEGIGTGLETTTGALKVTSERVGATLGSLEESITRGVGSLAEVQAALNKIASKVQAQSAQQQAALSSAVAGTKQEIERLQTQLAQALTAATEAVNGTSRAISDGLGNIGELPALGAAVGRAHEAIKTVEDSVSTMKEAATEAAREVKAASQAASSAADESVANIRLASTETVREVKDAGQAASTAAGESVASIRRASSETVKGVTEAGQAASEEIAEAVRGAGRELGESTRKSVSVFEQDLTAAAERLEDTLKRFRQELERLDAQ